MMRRYLFTLMSITVLQLATQTGLAQQFGLTNTPGGVLNETIEDKDHNEKGEATPLSLTATVSYTHTYGNDYFDGKVVFNQAVAEFRHWFMYTENCYIREATQVNDTEWSFKIVPHDYTEMNENIKVQVRANIARTASDVWNEESNTISLTTQFYKAQVYITDGPSWYIGAPTISEGATATSSTVVLRWNFDPWVGVVHGGQGVMNITKDDFVVTNGSPVGLRWLGIDAGYELQVQPAANGEVTVTLPLGATDFDPWYGYNLEQSTSFVSKAFPPAVVMTTDGEPNVIGSQVTGPYKVTFTWDETVRDFYLGDIQVTNGTASGYSRISGYTTYTALITPAALGDVTVTIPAGGATGTSGGNEETSLTYNYNYPNATITSTESGTTKESSFSVNIDFSESVDGLDISDFTVINANLSNLAGSGTDYTMDVVPTALGTVTLTLPANTVTATSNSVANLAEASFSIIADPYPNVSITAANTVSDDFIATISFDKAITGFELSDVQVTNGTASNLQDIGGNAYTVDITTAAEGTLSIDIAAGVAVDAEGNLSTAATTKNVTVAYPALTASISSADVANAMFIATIAFDRAITGFELSDIVVTNGTAANLLDIGSNSYTVEVTPDADGTVSIDVPAGAAADAKGKLSDAASTKNVTVLVTPLTVSFTTPDLVNGSFIATATFNQAVTGFTLADIVPGNANLKNFSGVGGDGKVFTFRVTPSSTGAVTLDLPANSAVNAVNAGNTVADQRTFTADFVDPVVTIAPGVAATNGANAFTINIRTSEAVTNMDIDKVTVTNATKSNFTDLGGNDYSLDLTADGNGDISILVARDALTDLAGNKNNPISASVELDQTAPTFTMNAVSSASYWGNISYELRIQFSEAVTGLALDDFTVSNGTVDSFTATDADTYKLFLTPDDNGLVEVNLAADAAEDQVAYTSEAGYFSILADFASPTVTMVGPVNKVSGTFQMAITFSEPVTGFAEGGIWCTRCTASNVAGSGTDYTVDITPNAGESTVRVQVNSGAAQDVVGRNNTGSARPTFHTDFVSPNTTISVADLLVNGVFTATITFSEEVTGFAVEGLSLVNATASNFSGTGTTYTADITPAATGDISLDVLAGVATDLAGNDNNAATQVVVEADLTFPTVTISAVNLVNGVFAANVGFSESVTGFELSDVVLTNATASNFSGSGANYSFDITPVADGAITIDIAENVAIDAANNANTAAVQKMVMADATQPTVTMSGENFVTTDLSLTINFSEAVTGFELADIAVTNATATNFSGSGDTYTLDLVAASEGLMTVNIAGDRAQDVAGNGNIVSSEFRGYYDVTKPEVTLTAPATATGAYTVSVVFNENIANFELSDFTVVNGTASDLFGVDQNYTIKITPTNEGPVSVSMAASTFEDTAGNENEEVAAVLTTYDVTAPTLNITGVNPAPQNFTASITFSEPVTGFELSDLGLVNATASNLTGTGANYTVDIEALTSGPVSIDMAANKVEDVAGNENDSYVVFTTTADITVPSVSIAADALVDGTFAATITFSEAVSGFELADVQLTNATASNFAGSDDSYTLDITPGSEGNITIDIAADVAVDVVGNSNTAATQKTVYADVTAPTVSISGDALANGLFATTITFSEDVTGFELSDLVLSNASASNFAGSDDSYTVDITPVAEGAFTIDIAANAAQDQVSRGSEAATQFSGVADFTLPTVSLSATTGSPNNVDNFIIDLAFSESVTGLETSDFTVVNGTAIAVAGSGSAYTVTIQPIADGDVTTTLNTGTYEDLSGNANIDQPSYAFTSDRTGPVASFSYTEGSGFFTVNINFDQEVTDFTFGDLNIGNATTSEFTGTGDSYSFKAVPVTYGTALTVGMSANRVHDELGNPNLAATDLNISATFFVPTLTIYDEELTESGSEITAGSTTPTTPLYLYLQTPGVPRQDELAVTASDFVTTNATITGVSYLGLDLGYEVAFTPDAQGTVEINLPAGAISRPGGDANLAASTSFEFIDKPLVTISAVPSEAVNGENVYGTFDVLFTWDEDVTDFEFSDVVYGESTARDFTQISPSQYSLTLTPTGGHSSKIVQVSIPADVVTNPVGNSNDYVSVRFNYDATTKTTITPSVTGPANVNSVSYEITFSQAVSYFRQEDLVVTNGTVTGFSGIGKTFNASVDVLGHGELTLTVPGGSATAGDFTGVTEATSSIFIDKIGPVVTMSTDFGDTYYIDPALISLTFDEEPVGFELSDITVTNGALANLTGSGTNYTAELTADAVGAVTLSIADDAFTDVVGNGNAAQTLSLTKGGQTGPVFTSTPITTIENKSANTYIYNPKALDPNGDEVTYSVPTLPEWLTYEGKNVVTTMATPDYSIGRARGVAVDSEGSLYVANSNHNVILKYDDEGNQSIYAGQWGKAGLVDGVTATAAKFRSPRYMVFDKDDNLFVVDQNARAIRKITPAGVVTTIAGANASGLVDGVGTDARFNDIRDIGVDNNTGTLYTTSWSNKVVRKITSDGTVTTFATGLFQSGGLAVDSNGNIFVTNYRELLKFTPDGTKTTFAGNYYRAGYTDGTGGDARFYQLFGMGIDKNDVLYLNDVAGIRQVTPEAEVTTLAGSRDLGTVDGIGTSARFWSSLDMASDGEGTIYVADQAKSTIRKIEATKIISGKPGGYLGDFDVVIEATDGINAATQQAYTISVINAVPTMTNFDFLNSCNDCSSWDYTVTTKSTITTKIVYDEPVFVTGEPYIELNYGDNKLVYASGSGTNTLLFQWAVTGDNDNKGVTWTGNDALKLNGGTIKDADGANAPIALGDDLEEIYILDFHLSVKSMTTTAETGTYGIGDQFDVTFELEDAPTGVYYVEAAFKLKGDDEDASELYLWQYAGDEFEETPGPKTYTFTITVKEGHYSEEDFDIPYLDEPFYIEGYVESDDGSVYYEFYDWIKFTDETPDKLLSPGKQIRLDGFRPTVTISTDTDLARAFVATLTFNEDVTALDLADILVTNGTASNLSGSGKVYTVDITPTAAGEVTIGLGADAAEDLGGNGNIEATPISVTGVAALGVLIDPTYNTGVDGLIGATLGGTATITFTDDVTGFELSDIVYSNLNITSFVANSAAEYVIEFSAVADGTATIDIPASVAMESNGFGNEEAVQVSMTADITAPVATLSFGESYTNDTYPRIDVNFSEDVVGLDVADFTWTNGGDEQNLEGIDDSYTLEFERVNEGLMTVQLPAGAVTDAAGNATLLASDLSLTVDTTKPTLSITTSAASVVNAPFTVNYTFSEIVTDFGTEDINVSNATVSDFTGSGNSYSVTLTPISDGLISTNVPAGVTEDLAGNTNLVGTALQVTANVSFPEVIISSAASGIVTGTVEVAIEFNESVDGLTLDDFTVSNGTVANLSGSGTSYTIELTPDSDGTSSVQLTANVAADAIGNGNQASNLFSVLADFTLPSAILSAGAADPTNESTIEVSIAFSESVTGLETSDFTVTNGSVANLSGSGDSYIVELSPASDGDVSLSLAAAAVIDAASNANLVSNTLSLTSDRTAPSVSISAVSLVNAAFTASINFSESVTGFDLADLTVSGATASNLSGSGSNYTVDITPTMDGNVSLNIASAVAQDAAGNDNTAATTATVLADLTQPGVIISSTETLVNGAFTVNIAFDESVSGFELSDLNVANATASNFTGSGAAYSVDLSPVADGAVTVNIAAAAAADDAGNANTAASQLTVTADLSAPTVTLSSAATSPSNADSYGVTITFSEAVTGLEASDFNVSNATVSALAGTGYSYTLTLSPSADGAVSLTLAAASVTDDAGNSNVASNELSITSDRTVPTVTASAATLVNGSFTVDFTFSEAVSGFDMTDLTVSNGTVTGLTGADASYTATINPTADGNVTVDVAADVAQDEAGNGNTAASTTTVSADLTQPGVSLSSSASLVNGVFSVDITFDEAVTGFELSDITMANATAANFSGSGTSYSVDLTPVTDGAITVDVTAAVAQDAAGNGNTAATQLNLEADLTAPTVTLSSTSSSLSNADSYAVTINFSEAVTGLETSDFTVSNGAISDLSGSGNAYTLTLSPTADGAVSLSLASTTVADAVGNSNEASNELIISSDRSAPSVTLSTSAVSPVDGSFTATFGFSEEVSGFSLSDLTLTNAVATDLAGSGSSYTATITPSTDGSVAVQVPANAVSDVAGNGNTASNALSIDADLTAPTITLSTEENSPTNATSFTLQINFSEPISRLELSDIVVSNGTASGLSGSGTAYTATISPAADGVVAINMAAGVVSDAAGNNNEAASTLIVTFDATAPEVTISSTASDLVYANSFAITITFSEEVTGFDGSDLSLVNATASDFAGSGQSYTANISPVVDGEVSVTVAGAKATDAAGNANNASNTLTKTVEATNEAPTAVALSNASIAENLAAGEEIGTLSATDPDLGDSHTFVLVNGDGDSRNAAFNVIGNALVSTASFDFETQSSYSIRVRATDNQGLTLDKVFTISIANTDEPAITVSIPDPADNALTVTDMSFENTRAGQTSQRTFNVTNSGTDGTLVVSAISLPTGFTVDATAFSLVAGESKTVTVTFAPTAEQTYSGNVQVSSNAGSSSFAIAGIGEVNNAPIAIAPATAFHYTEGGTLQLNGYDPDGDAISFEVVTAPTLGTLTATGNAGEFNFTPNSLSPETIYTDVIEFKVVETEGDLESATAEFSFTFEVTDAAHSITEFSASEVADNSRTITLAFDDVVINDNYQVDISYLDRTDLTNPVLVSLVSQSFSKSELSLTGTGASWSFEANGTDNAYLFTANQVFMTANLSTTNGFSDSESLIIDNGTTGGDNIAIGDTDGQFFVFAESVTVPENQTATLKLNAIDFGGFDLSNASIEIITDPASGSLGNPTLIKASANLVQWSITYEATTEVGLEDSFGYQIYSPSRNTDVDATVAIEVIEVNDAPVLASIADQQTNEEQSITIPVNITDPDSDVAITVTSSETTNVPVTVDGSNLVINPAIDFNGVANITVLVTETNEENPLSTFQQFALTVNPVNDRPVVNAISDLSMDEDGQVVVSLSATDADASLPIFDFTAVSDQPDAAEVSIEAGSLTIKPIENFNGTLNFSIYADDRLGTNASVSEAETFSLTINPVNDAPVVAESFSVQSIVQGFPSYELDLSAYFNDVETAAEALTYTVSDVSNVNLAIDGAVMTITTPDGLGVQTATVTASDGEYSASQNITFVTAEASGQLTVTKSLDNLLLEEDFDMVSLDLTGVFTYSEDANANFSYAISGNNNLEASMNGSMLEITTPANFNGSDVIFIVATTNGQSAFTSFGITVSGVNDAPELVAEIADYTAIEDEIFFKSVAGSAFTDVDGDDLSYEAAYDADWLSFDANTGVFSGIPTNGYVGTVTVTMTASDPSGEKVSSQFTINVLNTNDAPSALSLNGSSLDENEAQGYVIGELSTTDVDAGDSFVYALVNGEGDNDNASFAVLDNQLVSGTELDYENQDVYSIRVRTTDASGAYVEEVFAISLNNVNEAVTAIDLSNTEVVENAESGTQVGALSSVDPDTDDSFTYTLVAGEGDDDNAQFQLDGAVLSTASAFDFETKNSYQIRVRSTDAGGLYTENSFTILVDNVNEAPGQMTLSNAEIMENLSVTTAVGVFATTDQDLGDVHAYSLVSGEGADDNEKFSIIDNSLRVAEVLNYEEQSSYQVRVSATDNGGLTIERAYTIALTDVNESPTALTLSNSSLDENEAAGTVVGALSTTDEDNNDSHTYSLVTGAGDEGNAAFEISGNELLASESFDFETQSSYSIRVSTTDAGGLSFETQLTIAIGDVTEAEASIRVEGDLTFESTGLGDQATLDYTIFNDGNADLNITGITYPEGFSGSWTGGVVAAGASQIITVTFQPTEEKTYEGMIVITSDLGTQELAVSGEGAIVTSIDDPVFGPIEVKAYPNPATDFIKVDLSLLNGQPAKVSLWTINGNQKTATESNGFENELTIDVRSYREGIYLIRVESAGKTATKKVMIKR